MYGQQVAVSQACCPLFLHLIYVYRLSVTLHEGDDSFPRRSEGISHDIPKAEIQTLSRTFASSRY